jgi:hypothetical protein
MCIPLLPLVFGVAGCGFLRGGGGTHVKQKRPIAVMLVQQGSDCVAIFGSGAQHAYRADDIDWEFINRCTDPQTVTLAMHTGSKNPFTDQGAPWTLPPPPIPNGQTGKKILTVAQTAEYVTYKFDIIVNGKPYDPILEIDP